MTSKRKSAARVAAPAARKARPALPVVVDPGAPKNAQQLVEEAFRIDDGIRAVVRKNLKVRAAEAFDSMDRARKAFTNFRPSRVSSAERARRNFVGSGETLSRAMEDVAEKGVAFMKAQQAQRGLRIDLKSEAGKLINQTDAEAGYYGKIALDELLKNLDLKLTKTPTLRTDPAFTACAAAAEVEKRVAKIEGTSPTTAPTVTPAAGATPASDAATPADVTDAEADAATAAMVSRQVNIQMATARSPEEKLGYNVQARASTKETDSSVESFELRKGASDVTSYHDFQHLQIAFDYIWDELFDGELARLGQLVYDSYCRLEDYLNLPRTDRAVNSIEDLRKLMRDIRELSYVAQNTAPRSAQKAANSASSGGGTPITTVDFSLDLSSVTDVAAGVAARNAPIEGADRLSALLQKIDDMLNAPYAFDVFRKDSINFGIMVTYRQQWRPEKYQVGDLVSTIPLAPREIRRYTTRRVVKKTRAQKELDESLRTQRSEVGETSRAEKEIIDRAQNRTNYNMTAQESMGSDDSMKMTFTQQAGGDQSAASENVKKNFREAVLKSAEEYRQQHRMEVETNVSEETEETTFLEIQNPNDELAVTYLFYELQRVYRISEKIHKITPVVLVANEVPPPHGVDDAWLIAHDWILRRVLLDDSFRPALDYLTKSFVGAELNIQLLENNVSAQKRVVDGVQQQVEAQIQVVERDQRSLENAVRSLSQAEQSEGMLNTVKRVFDPIGLTGKAEPGVANAAQEIVDFAQATVDRAEREKQRLLQQLGAASTALQVAIDKLSAAVREHYDRVAEIDRLRVHVKANILHYMQAIWTHEPPDQRFFRHYDKLAPIMMPSNTASWVNVTNPAGSAADALQSKDIGIARLVSDLTYSVKPLSAIADLDRLLGFKGNFSIYALNENNYVTLHMMQNYLEVSDEVTLRDPDDFANYTVDQLQEIAACMFKRDRTAYDAYKPKLVRLIRDRLISGRPEDDRVIVPTTSLYIEALVGAHPLLEDYKLVHRALDVKKVQAEVRHAELENVRLAARALRGKDEDPDIEKKIIIEGAPPAVAVTPDN